MNEETLRRLDALAEKLGVATEYLWGVLIAQSKVAIVECIVGFIVGGLLLATTWYLSRKAAAADDYGYEGFALGSGALLLGIIGIVVLLVATFSIWTPLLNPEYYALKQVLGAIGSK